MLCVGWKLNPEEGQAKRQASRYKSWSASYGTIRRTRLVKTSSTWHVPPANSRKCIADKLKSRYPANIVRNQKYNVATFFPIVLYEQFKFFFNLYFLLVALSQFVPALRIGFLATYIAPLAFVLLITIGKEAYDDYQRYLRDVAANSTRYKILDRTGLSLRSSNTDAAALTTLPSTSIASSKLRVGDLVLITKNQRVPADCVLLRTSDASGSCFVRTDQLDGETDWKLRVAVERTQGLPEERMLLDLDAEVYGKSLFAVLPIRLLNIRTISTVQPTLQVKTFTTSSAHSLCAMHQQRKNPISVKTVDPSHPGSQLKTCCGRILF
jgi:magnesium-transporting ATPase (P-type)